MLLLTLLCARATMASDVLVSIQSQSVEEMEKLTAGIDAAVQDPASGPARVTLGAIEATMSRVVTVDEPSSRSSQLRA
jgi:hypothetical protein